MIVQRYVTDIIEGGYLSREAARTLCHGILDGTVPDYFTASVLTLLSSRPYAVSEVVGFREAIKERGLSVRLPHMHAIDVCGTGGDGKKTFNISTASAFVVAALGYPVVKHGNYAVSSSSGSSNILESLGYVFTTDQDSLSRQLDLASICFLHAPLFYPVMKVVAPIRKALGMKTIFNVLGPLLNPADVKNQVSGVYDLSVFRLYAEIFSLFKKNYYVIHSLGGYDEISLTSPVRIQGNSSFMEEDPQSGTVCGVSVSSIDPISLQIGQKDPRELFVMFLEGRASFEINLVVSLSAALAISLVDKKNTISFFQQRALEAILSGRCMDILKKVLSA